MNLASSATTRPSDVAIVGAGVIGLTVAWSLARSGRFVTLIDPSLGSGSSYAAAGMLAPVTEVHFGEAKLLDLNLAAASMWPEFVNSLHEASGLDIGYRRTGTVVVARDLDDRRELERLREFASSLGVSLESVTSGEVRQLEPLLASDVRGGLWAPDDHSVDNRRLLDALHLAINSLGVTIARQRASALTMNNGRVTGVTLENGTTIHANAVVVANGVWSAHLGGIPPHVAPPIRPVRGQILRLNRSRGSLTPAPMPRTTVRGLVSGRHIYIVPRDSGEVVVGATSDEVGYEYHVDAGAVWGLLNDARSLLPSLNEMAFVEACAGLRPGTPDNIAIVGLTEVKGLLMATGHHRNGILLAPLTAHHIVSLLDGDEPNQAATWDPRRFNVKSALEPDPSPAPLLATVGESA